MSAIPRLLHQTFPTQNVPPVIAAHIDTLRARNPGWQYRLWDDGAIEDFIRSQYGADMLASYSRIHPQYGSARADLFRYLLIHRLGGVYLDIKSNALQPLDAVLRPDDEYILSHWDNAPGASEAGMALHRELRHIPGGEYQQWHVIAAPGHAFLQAVIEAVLAGIARYHPLRHGAGKRAVLRLTGPIAYSLTIEPLRALHPHRLVNARTELGLRYSIFEAHEGPQSHTALFGTHYRERSVPVVQGPHRADALARLWLQAQGRLRHWNQQRKASRRSA